MLLTFELSFFRRRAGCCLAILCGLWTGQASGTVYLGHMDYRFVGGYEEYPTSHVDLNVVILNIGHDSLTVTATPPDTDGNQSPYLPGNKATMDFNSNGPNIRANGRAEASGQAGSILADIEVSWSDHMGVWFDAASLAEARNTYLLLPFLFQATGDDYTLSVSANESSASAGPFTLGGWQLDANPNFFVGGTLTYLYLKAYLKDVDLFEGTEGHYKGHVDFGVSVLLDARTNSGSASGNVDLKFIKDAVRLFRTDGSPLDSTFGSALPPSHDLPVFEPGPNESNVNIDQIVSDSGFDYAPTPAPEPTASALLLCGLALLSRRSRSRS